jgi:hypothetical protein
MRAVAIVIPRVSVAIHIIIATEDLGVREAAISPEVSMAVIYTCIDDAHCLACACNVAAARHQRPDIIRVDERD